MSKLPYTGRRPSPGTLLAQILAAVAETDAARHGNEADDLHTEASRQIVEQHLAVAAAALGAAAAHLHAADTGLDSHAHCRVPAAHDPRTGRMIPW